MKWYSLERILEKDCDYNFIFSGRGPGKSTAIVNHLIDCFENEKSEFGNPAQFVRIVRYDWAISRTMMTGWFNEINQSKLAEYGRWVDFRYGEWRVRDLTDDGKRDEDSPYQVMGYVLPLNAQDDYKSGIDYSNVTNIVFEEFVQLRERDYVESETQLFMSALSTVVRNRQNVKVWFIGNTLTKYNPYFQMFGLDLDRIGMQPGDLKTFRVDGYAGHGATIALEYAEMAQEDMLELSPLMRISGNITATTGVFAQDPTVADYKARTAKLIESDLEDALPWHGCYLGDGRYCRVRITRYPVSDDARMLVLSSDDPTIDDLQRYTWLNLSGEPNPSYEVLGHTLMLRCASPLGIQAISTVARRLQDADARCAHAYETDEIRYKWRTFVDGIGYEKGQA